MSRANTDAGAGAKLGIPNAGEGAYDAAREGDEDPANEKEPGWALTDAPQPLEPNAIMGRESNSNVYSGEDVDEESAGGTREQRRAL